MLDSPAGERNKTMIDELRPCPFCGNPFEITNAESGNRKEYFIVKHEYENCPLLMDGENGEVWLDKSRLVEMLNARPIEDALRAELAKLCEEYDILVEEIRRLDALTTEDHKPSDQEMPYVLFRVGHTLAWGCDALANESKLTAELAALKDIDHE